MNEVYLYNKKTNKLHIKGYCSQSKNGYSDSYISFETENEALAHDGKSVGWCKSCLKKREQKMEELK